MIKIQGQIQTATDIIADKEVDNTNVRELNDLESQRVFNLFITQLFENTIVSEHPVIVYKFPIDKKASLVQCKSIIEDLISDYFFGNFYALPSIKISADDHTVEIYSLTSNNFIGILDNQLTKELSNFLEDHKELLKVKSTIDFRYLNDLQHQMPAFIMSRKVMLLKQLRELGYKTSSSSDNYIITISV